MAEDVQHTLSVTELLDAKIASGKETLRQKRLLFYSNLFFIFKSKDVPSKKLAWEELLKIGKDIKKWKKEKREFLLAHEEQLKKPEENQSPETKECPMCAETIKAKAIICRFCGHKFESETNSVNEEPP